MSLTNIQSLIGKVIVEKLMQLIRVESYLDTYNSMNKCVIHLNLASCNKQDIYPYSFG